MPEPALAMFGHEQLLEGVEALAASIEAGAWHPDALVGIGRGGLVPTVYLSHRLGLPMHSLDWSGGDAAPALRALADRGERLLFVDDINDSGSTIAELRTALGSAAAAVRFAVLIDNRRSRARVDHRARTIDRTIDTAWFVFPWESVASRATIAAEARTLPERLG